MTHPDLRQAAAQLQGLFRRASDIDPRALPRDRPDALDQLADDLSAVVAQAAAVVAMVQTATDQGDVGSSDWGDHFEDTLVGDSPIPADAAVELGDELWRQVSDLAFTAGSELRRAARMLERRKPDELAAVCGSARRKVRRAIAALLAAIGSAQGDTYPIGLDHGAELEAALAVRTLYAKFRKSLPPCDRRDPTQVRRALRLAAVAVAVLVGHADFGEAREEDRRLIQRLQRRILAWARDGAAEEVGARLHQDLTAVADLLRAINLRQELVNHDRAALAELRAVARGAHSHADQVTLALPILRGLVGFDDHLDEVLAAAQSGVDATTVVRELAAAMTAYAGDAA